jgi:hypothetical protein
MFSDGAQLNLLELALANVKSRVQLKVEQIRMSLRDIKARCPSSPHPPARSPDPPLQFWFRRKRWPLRMQDSGLMDVDLTGKRGACITFYGTRQIPVSPLSRKTTSGA